MNNGFSIANCFIQIKIMVLWIDVQSLLIKVEALWYTSVEKGNDVNIQKFKLGSLTRNLSLGTKVLAI